MNKLAHVIKLKTQVHYRYFSVYRYFILLTSSLTIILLRKKITKQTSDY